jgi:hypothetical protein
LSHYDAEPPVEVWNNISEKLYQARRKSGIFWFARIAAGIAILTVLSLSYFLTRKVLDNKLITGDESKVEKSTEENVPAMNGKQDKEKTGTLEYKEEQTAATEKILQSTGSEQNKLASAEPPIKNELPIQEKYTGTEPVPITTISSPSLSFIQGKYIGKLEYEIPGRQIKPFESGKSIKLLQKNEIPAETTMDELYALNIPLEDESPDSKWGIGTQFSPLYSYRSLEIDEKSLMSSSYYNKVESGMIAYSGGINVNYVPTRRISLQSGVYYSKYGLSVDNAYYYENIIPDETASVPKTKFYSVNNSSGEIDVMTNNSIGYVTNYADRGAQNNSFGSVTELSDQVNNGEIIQNFEYIEVPLIVRYKVIDRKIGFNFLGGLSTNLLVGSNTYYNEDGNKEKIGKTTDIKPFNYSSILGAGICYTISKRFNINLEPTFRYYLNSINESSDIKSHPYSMGIFTGLSYYF